MELKKNTLLALAILSLSGSGLAANPAEVEDIFCHDFDKERPKKSTASGFSIFGEPLAASAVTKRAYVSRPNAASISVDMASDAWGVILMKDEDLSGNTLDLRDATLSVSIKASSSFATSEVGPIGFKLIDADGTEMRTDEFDLFRPSLSFSQFKQHVDDLYFVENPGENAKLDLENITRYAIVFYDKADKNKTVTFYLDDFKAQRESLVSGSE